MGVRLATVADIPALMELERRCETAAHWSEAQYRSALPACGAGLTSRLILVLDHGVDDEEHGLKQASSLGMVLAGFLVARHLGPEWELENIVVALGARRQGVATLLLEELLRRARGVGSESVHLEVRESNREARAFYEKYGFQKTARRRGYYTGPGEDAVVYRRSL
jgi:ribosomal-protein-alanine N-acetyltransferase